MATKILKNSFVEKDFYQSSSDWIYSMYQSQTVWLMRSLVASLFLLILLGLSLTANICLLPLKEKVPYLYAFDHATGEVTKIGVLDKTNVSSNWEVARYFLIHYVINYEGYNADNIDYPYQMVWAQSSDEVRKQFDNQVNSTNVNSPYKIYGKDKFVTAKVISVNRLNENTVDIKFEKKLHDRTSNVDQITYKEAIVKWDFSNAELTQKMLDRDPLGFKVTYYQVSQVTLDNNL
ncbi:MAG: type IV secretion system protein [Gammaproteobacteria bacterium]